MVRTLRPFAAVVVALLALSACDGEPAPTETVTVTETVTPTPPGDASPEPTPSPTETGTSEPPEAVQDPCAAIAPFGAQLAFIIVTAPAPGTTFVSGDTVEGCGDTFEAGYEWELLDGQQTVLVDGFDTMTCGSGCQGNFSFTVNYTVQSQQMGTLRVFESSAKDGSPIHVNSIPVLLQP